MSAETKTVALYRIENPNIQATPDGKVSHVELIGQWFSTDLDIATRYLRKSTKAKGAQLVVAHVPEDQLAPLHVSQHPIASNMQTEPDNYIVPRDGAVSITTIPLDNTLEGLTRFGVVSVLEEARTRIRPLAVYAGELSLT